jgi:iron complex outermembrane receptor protein
MFWACATDCRWGEYNHTDFISLRQSAPNTVVAAVDPWAPVVGSFPTNDSAYTSGNQLYASRLDTVSVLPRMR